MTAPTPQDPVSRRVARASVPGEAAIRHSPPRVAAGTTSPQPPEPPRAAAGSPDPATGPDAAVHAPGSGRGRDQSPAPDAAVRASAPGAGSTTEEQRAAQRDAWKRAQSGHNHRKRAGRVTRAAKQAGPGMVRKAAPGTPGGAA